MKTWKIILLLLPLIMAGTLCTSDPAPIAKATVEGKEYPVYAFFEDIKPVSVVNPEYPFRARNEGRGGETLVGAVVNEKGRVSQTFVAKSDAGEDIQQAACAAVKKWRFPKLKQGGQPVAYVLYVPIVLNSQ